MIKNSKWPRELISACVGLGICLLTVCLLACLDLSLFYADGFEFWLMFDFGEVSKYIIVYGMMLNLLLTGMGLLVLRLKERIRRFRGKAVFLIIPVFWEILAMTLDYISSHRIVSMYIIFVILIGLMTLAGVYIRTYRIRTYLIFCAIAFLLMIPCVLYMIVGCYAGYCCSFDLVRGTMLIQLFAVFFPVISLIKRVIYASDNNMETAGNKDGELREKMDDVGAVCPFCGKEQEAGHKFCVRCGQKLSVDQPKGKFCPHCGMKVTESMLFCGDCGTRLKSEAKRS